MYRDHSEFKFHMSGSERCCVNFQCRLFQKVCQAQKMSKSLPPYPHCRSSSRFGALEHEHFLQAEPSTEYLSCFNFPNLFLFILIQNGVCASHVMPVPVMG